MHYDKTGLENLIFFYAGLQKRVVYVRRGCLACPGACGALRELMRVYNRFFGKENRREEAQDAALTARAQARRFETYRREAARNPLAAAFHPGPVRKH